MWKWGEDQGVEKDEEEGHCGCGGDGKVKGYFLASWCLSLSDSCLHSRLPCWRGMRSSSWFSGGDGGGGRFE